MKKQKNIMLSSSWTFSMLWLALIVTILFIPIIFLAMLGEAFHMGMIFGFLICLFALFMLYYLFTNAAEARIIDDKLILRRIGKLSKSYSFDKIGKIEAFTLSRQRYTRLEMKSDEKEMDFYLIANNGSLPYDEPMKILKALKTVSHNESEL